ncbi:NACHT domain-containing protein [Dictyobacter kobayashii]
MLRRVRSRWITGVLEHISSGHLLTLNLQAKPDAVGHPWKSTIRENYTAKKDRTENLHIMQVYHDADGELLILGEPGAGKTTLLLDLLRELIKRAEIDSTLPIPVIFNLSAWAEKRPPFADWLIEELMTKYQVPQKLAAEWIQYDHIVPLLDGLDEVEEAFRTACIEAINGYRQEHGLLSMVVCSRKTDYLSQSARIILNSAVVVQPLAAQQIDSYISQAGPELEAMDYALKHDTHLQEMASNPLMLTILALSYRDMPLEEVLAMKSLETSRNAIFEKYVERLLLQQNTTDEHFTPQQTKRWLGWLAEQLTQHSQTEFYIERMQPDWLCNDTIRHHYRHVVVRLIFSLEIIIISALFSLLRGGRIGPISGVGVGLLGWLGSGPGNSALGWMAPGLGGGLEGGGSLGIIIATVTLLVTLLIDRPIPKLSWRMFWHSLSQGIQKGLFIGAAVGIVSCVLFGLDSNWNNGLYRGMGMGLFSGLLIGLMTGLITGLRYDSQRKPHPQNAHRSYRISRAAIIDTWIFALCGMIGFGAINALLVRGINASVIIYALIMGIFFGIAFGIGGGTRLIRDIGVHIQPAETVAWSWREIGRNLTTNIQKGLGISIIITLSTIAIIAGASGFFYGLPYGLRYGLIYGIIIGLVSGVASILTGILHSGWSSTILEEHQLTHANEGIRRSSRNALIAAGFFGVVGGIASGLVCGIAFGWIGQLHHWPTIGIGFALICGAIFALQAGMLNGGIACIEHYMLRLYLCKAGHIPWKYRRFLDYATKHILLQKIGGGYMFSHRLLLEHFASSHLSASHKKLLEIERLEDKCKKVIE